MSDKLGNVMINLNGTYTVAQFNIIDYILADLKKSVFGVEILQGFLTPDVENIWFIVSLKISNEADIHEKVNSLTERNKIKKTRLKS